MNGGIARTSKALLLQARYCYTVYFDYICFEGQILVIYKYILLMFDTKFTIQRLVFYVS